MSRRGSRREDGGINTRRSDSQGADADWTVRGKVSSQSAGVGSALRNWRTQRIVPADDVWPPQCSNILRLSSHLTMSLLSVSTAASLARQCARPSAVRSSVAALQVRNAGSSATTAESYTSPFRGTSNHRDTTHIPDFKKYRNTGGETQNKVFQYFMVGTFGAVTALGAKATVQGMPTSPNATPQSSRHGSNMRCRLPRQHVRLRRCLGSGQG